MGGRVGVRLVLRVAPLALVCAMGCSSMLAKRGIPPESLDQLRKGMSRVEVESLVGNKTVDTCVLADGHTHICYKTYVKRDKDNKRHKRVKSVHGTMGLLMARTTRTGNTYASGIAAAGVGAIWLGAEAIMSVSEWIALGQRKRFVHIEYDQYELVHAFAVTHDDDEKPLLTGIPTINGRAPPPTDAALVSNWKSARRVR